MTLPRVPSTSGRDPCLIGMPVPRNWYANLRANSRFVVHLKHGVTACDREAGRRTDTAARDRRDP
jgi:hypothetical protein